MQRTSKWKIIVAPSIAVVVLALCCLFYPFFAGSSQEERYELQPKEPSLTTDYFTVEITNAYMEKQQFWQIAPNPLKPELITEDVLVLDIRVTNHLPTQLDLICYMKDSTGYSYSPQFEANRAMFESGNVFIPSFKPLEIQEGRMEFYSLPNDSQELWFHCGLCDNSFACVEGKLNDVAAQIR